jgi:ectoine hydroxylase-related dioxygenase (phytanoyl-CoA dioxygenase family)
MKTVYRVFAGAAMREVKATIQPLEIAASPGDVVFFHHRCVHSTGINTNKNSVRHAVIMG